MKKLQLNTDEDTILLFEIVSNFLVIYFNYKKDDAIELINNFYGKFGNGNSDDDDNNFHYDGPYVVACLLHYYHLNNTFSEFDEWRRANGYWNIPQEATNYYLKKFGII